MSGDNVFIYDEIVRAGDISVVPSSNFQPGYEPSKIKNIWVDYVYRSLAGTKNATIEIESEGSVVIATTGCALYGLNLTGSYTTLKLQMYTTQWVDVANFDYDSSNGRAIVSYAEVSASKYRIVMDDPTVASYVQLGVIVLGSSIQLSRGYEYGATNDLDDTSAHIYSKDGHLNVMQGREVEAKTVTYEVMLGDESRLERVYRKTRKRFPLVFVEDHTQAKETMRYIIFEGRYGRRIPGNLFKTISLSWLRLD